MKSLTKGRIKLELVTLLAFSPVILAGLVMLWLQHPRKAQAMQAPSFRILWYPNCSPAWAGGTIWQHGFGVPNWNSGIPTWPYCDGPTYIPGFMPQFIGFDNQAAMVIDTTTNYCGSGDIQLGMAWTQISWIPLIWHDVVGSTNYVTMPNGYTESYWFAVGKNLPGYGYVPVLGGANPIISCPGGTGTGGQ